MHRARSRQITPQHWNIRAVMRDRGIRSSLALARLLAPYIDISEDLVRRMVAGTPRRPPPLEVLDALCYILKCSIIDLIPIDHRRFDPTATVTDEGHRRLKRSKVPGRGNVERPKIKPLGDPTGVLPTPTDFL